MKTAPSVSIIIPSKNEEYNIGFLLDSILCNFPVHIDHEIIVVDNKSEDNTAYISQCKGARIVYSQAGTIGGVRNDGAASAMGSVYVFLDSDIILTKNWGEEFSDLYTNDCFTEKLIIGSKCLPCPDDHWLSKAWYTIPESTHPSHLGSAHLIIQKFHFFSIGGFDDTLPSGEDYDLCRRFQAIGGRILANNRLKVFHRGNPQSVLEFISREAWHGLSDFNSISTVARSRVAIATILFLSFHIMLIFSIFMRFPIGVTGSLFAIFILCFASSAHRFKGSIRAISRNSLTYYFYYIGRCFSLFLAIKNKLILR